MVEDCGISKLIRYNKNWKKYLKIKIEKKTSEFLFYKIAVFVVFYTLKRQNKLKIILIIL